LGRGAAAEWVGRETPHGQIPETKERRMLDQLKKALTTGVAVALKTWDEVEALGKEMIKKAKLPEKEASQLLKNLKQSYEKTQKNLESRVHGIVKDVLKKADVATSDEVKALKREIQGLKKDLKAAKAPKTAKPKTAKPKPKTRPAS
jgi:polyhydroxyalkanoate synthesis regulator phasin